MATKKKNTGDVNDLNKKLQEQRIKLGQIRLDIRSGKEKNTNAHKDLKKEIAQTLTKINQLKKAK